MAKFNSKEVDKLVKEVVTTERDEDSDIPLPNKDKVIFKYYEEYCEYQLVPNSQAFLTVIYYDYPLASRIIKGTLKQLNDIFRTEQA